MDNDFKANIAFTGANTRYGNGGKDKVTLGAGDDTAYLGWQLIMLFGNDFIDGGKGKDIAIFNGRRDQYNIIRTGQHYTVKKNNGKDGNNSLKDIEILSFSDQDIDITPNGPFNGFAGATQLRLAEAATAMGKTHQLVPSAKVPAKSATSFLSKRPRRAMPASSATWSGPGGNSLITTSSTPLVALKRSRSICQ